MWLSLVVGPFSQLWGQGLTVYIVEARKLEHGFRRISARTPYILPLRHGDNDVPTLWLLL